jgi:hypothetical protein
MKTDTRHPMNTAITREPGVPFVDLPHEELVNKLLLNGEVTVSERKPLRIQWNKIS